MKTIIQILKNLKPRTKIILFAFLVLVVAMMLAACSTNDSRERSIILPGAYQFCIDHPDHEECRP